MLNKLILCGFILTISQVLSIEIITYIPNGRIKGRVEVSARNVTFYAFQQIPYGKPPVGKLRFKAPEPVDNWADIFDATINDKVCYQVGSRSPLQTEDCLYVNVYTPVIPRTPAKLPVLFYIYGGGFVSGDNLYTTKGPHYFMEHDVVIVSVNYRVGPFGFLSTGDTVIPGNFGLKDQVLALKWVKNNIQYFGGDPEKVTIFGLSAGAASVAYLTMSKQSEGLFRAAIEESGSSLCPWTYQRDNKDIAYKLASRINSTFSPNATSEELLELLQNAPVETINMLAGFPESPGHEELVQGYWYTPTVEPEHETAFLTKPIYETIANGVPIKVPLVIGICSEEQIGKAANINNFKTEVSQYDKDVALLVNDNMHLTDHESKVRVGEAIRKIYTDGLFVDDLGGAVRYFTDVSFSLPIIHHAQLQSQYSDVYFYQFSYRGALGGGDINVPGAGKVYHTEDKYYLWAINNSSDLDSADPADILTSERYITLFTDFAKTLNPTPQPSSLTQNLTWPKVTPELFQFLNIDKDLEIQTNPKEEAYKGWVDLYEKYAVKPYDTF